MDNRLLVVTIVLLIVLPAWGQTATTPPNGAIADPTASESSADETDRIDMAKIAEAVAPSLVRVEYTLKYDKGEEPSDSGWRYRCPNCGRFHGVSEAATVKEERPFETEGFLISPTRLLVPDMLTHRRFVESIAVRHGDELRQAKVVGWAVRDTAQLLEIDKPLDGAKPFEFSPDLKGPYYTITYARQGGLWTIAAAPLGKTVSVKENGKGFICGRHNSVVIDKHGRLVGAVMCGELYCDGSWKADPAKQPFVRPEEMRSWIEDIKRVSRSCALRVALSFRSPKKQGGLRRWQFDNEEEQTERNVLGILVEPTKVLVLANLKPKVTARLQRIQVHTDDGRKIPAKFSCTLRDYGAFIATVDVPLTGAADLSSQPIERLQHQILMAAQVRVQGEVRTDYFTHNRIVAMEIGWRNHLYPRPAANEDNIFLFDRRARLVAFPIAHRTKASTEEKWSPDSGPVLTASRDLIPVLADLAANTDPSNIPLTEAEENRLAWLGVELQPLNKELARANKVSKLSRDGEIGGLVSYVYPRSPAAEAGIEPGDILLRLHVEEYPKPVEVDLETYLFSARPFPWNEYDQVPEQYYDHIPTPWSPAENSFTRALTDIGFGKKFKAEFFRDGQTIMKEFTVVQSPPHYDSAEKYKSEQLGLTVRNLTYEVRRYFQKSDEEPGVVVSKIEPGGKASVSGIKPYEIITEVNGQPVMNVKDFSKAVAGRSELRLAVKRMAEGRVVTIRLKAATTKPAEDVHDGKSAAAG